MKLHDKRLEVDGGKESIMPKFYNFLQCSKQASLGPLLIQSLGKTQDPNSAVILYFTQSYELGLLRAAWCCSLSLRKATYVVINRGRHVLDLRASDLFPELWKHGQ